MSLTSLDDLNIAASVLLSIMMGIAGSPEATKTLDLAGKDAAIEIMKVIEQYLMIVLLRNVKINHRK